MDKVTYQARYAEYAAATERRLEELCDLYLPGEARISRAARYSLLGGGKRVRAVLALAGWPASRPNGRWTMPARWRCCTAIR